MLKENNNKIELKEHIFRNMIEYSNDLIWVLDKEGMVTYINKKAEDISGLRSADIVGKHFSLLIPPEDLPRIQKTVNETLAGKPQTYEAVVNLSETRKLYLMVNAAPMMESNKIIGVVSFGCDITERVKADEIINKSAEEWHKTFNAISDYVFILDNYNNILRANDAFLKFIGMEAKDVLEKKCYEVLHGLNKPWPGCPFEKAKIDNKPHNIEIDDPAKKVHFLISVSPILNERSEMVEIVHIARDISEIANTKKMLEKKISDLEIFVKASVGRELKMMELKKRVSGLEGELKEKNGN